METAVETATRLLSALGELVDQEGMYLRGGYYDLAREVRQRAAPVVQSLTGLAGQPGVGALEPQIMAVVRRGEDHAGFLREKLVELSDEIRRTDRARQRTAQVAPAYKQTSGAAAARFRAAG